MSICHFGSAVLILSTPSFLGTLGFSLAVWEAEATLAINAIIAQPLLKHWCVININALYQQVGRKLTVFKQTKAISLQFIFSSFSVPNILVENIWYWSYNFLMIGTWAYSKIIHVHVLGNARKKNKLLLSVLLDKLSFS